MTLEHVKNISGRIESESLIPCAWFDNSLLDDYDVTGQKKFIGFAFIRCSDESDEGLNEITHSVECRLIVFNSETVSDKINLEIFQDKENIKALLHGFCPGDDANELRITSEKTLGVSEENVSKYEIQFTYNFTKEY